MAITRLKFLLFFLGHVLSSIKVGSAPDLSEILLENLDLDGELVRKVLFVGHIDVDHLLLDEF